MSRYHKVQIRRTGYGHTLGNEMALDELLLKGVRSVVIEPQAHGPSLVKLEIYAHEIEVNTHGRRDGVDAETNVHLSRDRETVQCDICGCKVSRQEAWTVNSREKGSRRACQQCFDQISGESGEQP